MYAQMRSQQAGGLTDEQIKIDARQSFRTRNWFDIKWTTLALIAVVNLNDKTVWNTKLFGTIGDRSSVGFLQSITVKDTINASTLQYNGRTVNIDKYSDRLYSFI